MRTSSPVSADDDLFAAKGQAVPLDKTREKTRASTAAAVSPVTSDSGTAPLPGMFTEQFSATGPDSECGTPAGTDAAEPPPAASLLTIVSQGSAARSRTAARAVSEPAGEPDTDIHDAPATAAPDAGPAAQTDAAAGAKVYLPVPVRINLPAVVASPHGPTAFRYRNAALLAASIALLVAGTLALYAPATPDRPPMPGNGLAAIATPDAARPVAPAAKKTSFPGPTIASERPKAEIASVRFDNAGRVIVNGAAPPETELIVLRDRRPLGTARSDADGRWRFAARVPTRTERHEISVVPLHIETSVLVDQPSFVPRPGRRPAPPPHSGGPAETSYFVQIASLPSAADAEREAAKLTPILSDAFATDRIAVRSATIDQGRTVYRVAIAGFSTKESAAAACARIRALQTRCLVMQEP